MPNITVSQDIDSFIKSVDKVSARTSLGLGTAATRNAAPPNSGLDQLSGYVPVLGPDDAMLTLGASNITGKLRYATNGGVVDTYFESETFNYIPSYGAGCGSLQIQFPPGGSTPSNMRLLANGNTAPRDYTFPDASGTFTLTSDLSAYVPKTRTVNGQSLSANITITTDNSILSAYVPKTRTVNGQSLSANITITTDNSILSAYVPITRTVNGQSLSANITITTDNSILSAYVPKTRTVNGQSLSANITISSSTIPISSVTGLGAGVATALALSANTANGFVRRGALGEIASTDAHATISTSGSGASIYTTGANGIIWTTGSDASIYTLGANAFIAADGVNSYVQSRGTFKLNNGTFTTTLSHIPTALRTITFPNASGIVRLVETPVTLGSLSGAVTFNRDSGLFQNATLTSSLTANISGGSDWNSLDLWLTALSGADRTLDLNAAIQKPSDSAISFPVTITSGKGCRVKFEKHGATWMLVSLVKSYTL